MSFTNLFARARKAISEWRSRERAYGELMALDDRALADIGIRRSEIPAIVEGVHASLRSAGSTAVRNATVGSIRQTA